MSVLVESGWVCGACGTQYADRPNVCVVCLGESCFVPNYRRPAAQCIPQPGGISARDLASQDQRLFKPGAYSQMRLGRGAGVTLAGPPGSGKTTLGLKFADSLAPSCFMAFETGAGPVLAEMLRRLEIRNERLWIERPESVNRIRELFERPGLRCVVADSGNACGTMLPEDWFGLARATGVVVLVLLQVTKSGLHAGSNAWLHDSDVNLYCESFMWTMSKSRYQDCTGVQGEV